MQLSYIPTSRSSVCIPIGASAVSKSGTDTSLVMSDVALGEDLKLLLPGESSAFAFIFTEYSDLSGRPPGCPQVKWCTSMGEFSIYHGDFTYPRPAATAATATGTDVGAAAAVGADAVKSIRYECLSCPGELYVGDECEIVIRVYNTTSRAMSVHLDCKTAAATQPATGGVSKGQSGGAMRPRLSTNSNVTYANVLTSSAAGAASTKTDGGAGALSSASSGTQQLRGLCFCGLTFTPLGIIESLDFSDVTVSVYATSAGQHDLPTLYLIDSITGDRHPIEAACSVFVHDNEEWDEDEAPHGQAETKAEPSHVLKLTPPVLATPAKVAPAVAVRPPPVPVLPKPAEKPAEKVVVEEDPELAMESVQVETTLPPVPPASSMESLELNVSRLMEESAREMEQLLGPTTISTTTASPNTLGMSDAEDIDIEMA